MLARVIIVVIFTIVSTCRVLAMPRLQVSLFQQHLVDIADNVMGAKKMQSLIDSAQFERLPIDGEKSISEFARTLSAYFNGTFSTLKDVKELLQTSYSAFGRDASQFTKCCEYPSEKLENDARLASLVDFSDTCYRVSRDSPETHTIPSSDALFEKFLKLFDDNSIVRRAYFGTEEGVSVTYPALHEADCRIYDPRYRPWYVTTATPVDKDIAVILDRSRSMSVNDVMFIAREATKTGLGTLNPNDRVGLVVFSTTAETPPGDDKKTTCFSSNLAYMTADNLAYLRRFLDTVKADGGTKYLGALEKAFAFFINTPQSRASLKERQKVVVFLTDGNPLPFKPVQILQRIATLNAQLNNQVLILTYAFGEGVDSKGQELLLNMSRQTLNDQSIGPVTEGAYQHIVSVNNLRYKLGSYYNELSKFGQLDTPVITVPYLDDAGQGLVMSICLPIYYPPGKLRGVTAVDIGTDDLIAQVAYLRHGENSYAFLIDDTGRTYMHPLLSNSELSSGSQNGVFIDISALEPDKEALDVIESMKRGESGSKKFMATIVQSRGDSRHRGVKATRVNAHYYWRPIRNTQFSVCFVVTEQDRQLKVRYTKTSQHFLYHRLDLRSTGSLCQVAQRLATIERSVVKFTGTALKNAYLYFEQKEDTQSIRRIENYINGLNSDMNVFQEGIREMVIMSEQMENQWMNQTSALWYYVGFSNGVFRLYPGTPMAKTFDHTTRHWYQTAVANRGKLCLSTPYEDALGHGTVISLSLSLFEGRLSGTRSKEDILIGVIGMDIRITDMRNMLHKLYPECAEKQHSCFIVDGGGFLVYHDDFLKTAQPTNNVHIVHKEPFIARHLITNGYMTRQSCSELSTKRTYFSWKLEAEETVITGNQSPEYQLQYVQDTNIYVGVKLSDKYTGAACHSCAQNNVKGIDILRCAYEDDDVCQCPCYIDLDFDYCQNSFPPTDDGYPICFPDNIDGSRKFKVLDDVALSSALPLCFRTVCSELDVIECKQGQAREQCGWCMIKLDDGATTSTGCNPIEQCRVAPSNKAPVSTEKTEDDDTPVALIGGLAAAGVVVLIVTVAAAILCIRRSRSTTAQRPESEYDHYVAPDNVSRPSSDSTGLSSISRVIMIQ